MGLALDVGFGGLALVVEGGEGLIEPVLGGFAGVDRAAQSLGGLGLRRQGLGMQRLGGRCHHAIPPAATAMNGSSPLLGALVTTLSRSPKKRGPFQRVPVIARATSDRLA